MWCLFFLPISVTFLLPIFDSLLEEMAQSVNFLACKHDIHLVLRIHVKSSVCWHMPVIPPLWKQRQEDLWGLLHWQSSLTGKILRDYLGEDWQCPKLPSAFHMHSYKHCSTPDIHQHPYTHACEHMQFTYICT